MTPGLAFLCGGMPRASAKVMDSAWVHRGRWDPVFELPNVAIHTHVLPNGKVLFWGRRDTPAGSMHEHGCTPHTWDPRTGELIPTPQPKRADGTTVNLFCSGHAFLPDGRLLVVGGHATDGDGLDQACVYDFRTNGWAALPVMNERRWYPTATALPDGSVLVSSGSYQDSGRVILNDVPQIWDGHQWRPGARVTDLALDLRGLPWNRDHQDGRSVSYATGKALYIGGSDGATDAATAAAHVVDLRTDPPVWRAAASMHVPRRQHHATILADGTVLVTGGTSGSGFNDLSPGEPVHAAELWNPATQEWEELAAEDVDRCYHATAVLLPDATVLSAGGGEFTMGDEPNDPSDSHRNAQIFHPPYLFRGPRPEIISAPEETAYGETFSLEISGPEIGKVTWVRLPSVTHASDQSQRINVLAFRCDHGSVTIATPQRPETCPPGHYMLFVLSKAGVPSRARIIRIGEWFSQ